MHIKHYSNNKKVYPVQAFVPIVIAIAPAIKPTGGFYALKNRGDVIYSKKSNHQNARVSFLQTSCTFLFCFVNIKIGVYDIEDLYTRFDMVL